MQRIQIITDKNATIYHSITLIFNKKTKNILQKKYPHCSLSFCGNILPYKVELNKTSCG